MRGLLRHERLTVAITRGQLAVHATEGDPMTRSAMASRLTAVTGALAISVALLTIPVASSAAPTAASSSGATEASQGNLPAANPDYVMPKVPVWVNIGDRGLGGVTVSVLDAKGKVRATARTNTKGVVLIPRTFLRGKHTLEVTAGTAWRKLGSPSLSTGELIGTRNAAIIISPLTSIAHRVAKHMDTSYTAALLRTRKAFGIGAHVNHLHAAATDHVLHTGRLKAWSKKHGSLHAGMDHLAKQIADGKDVPHFRPAKARETRGETSTVAWVGETIMSGVLSGSGSYGANVVLGDVFGAANPTTALLTDINGELQEIVTELVAIEASLQELIYLMEQTSFQVLNAGMADLEGAVNGNDTGTGLWAVYISATTLNPDSTSYEADISGFAASFYNGIYSILPTEVGELFDSPTSTGLLHEIYNFNTAPWWNSDDVASISSLIDYYGTLQAQAVTLLNEAWWSPNKAYQQTADDINSFNTTNYGPQNADIYLSMPTQILDSQIGLPKTQQVIQAFPTAVATAYQQKTGNYSPQIPTCSDDGQTVVDTLPYPTVDNNEGHWDDTWAAAVPAGWTVQTASILNSLEASRKLPNATGGTSTTYTIANLVQGVPRAFAVVTSGELPRAGYTALDNGGHAVPGIQEWMFCENAAVPLDNLSSWQVNFEAVVGNETYPAKHVPAGAPTNWIDLPIPLGVLGAQPASFKYVQPTAPSTS